MTRTYLPNRRANITTEVKWQSSFGPDQKLIVTYGLISGKVREAFCASFRADTEICAMANDAMVLFSMLMQYGADLQKVAAAMGENRQEGASSGPPSSLIGAIVRHALEIERGV